MTKRCGWLVAMALVGVACKSEQSMSIRVFTPDAGDPWVGADAATQARLRVEDRETPDQTVSVSPTGSFALQVELVRPDLRSRVVVEALRGGEVIGSGGTPLELWSSFGPTLLPVWVQLRDSVVVAPWGDGTRRTRPFLFALATPYLAMLSGATVPATVDVFDALVLRHVDGAASIDDAYNRDASAIMLGDGSILVLRGCAGVIWTPSTNTTSAPASGHAAPQERCDVIASSVVQEPDGGGLVLGGHDTHGPVDRVDRIMPDGTWVAAASLTTPRDRPSVLRLAATDALIAGGQSATADYLERWAPDLTTAQRTVHTGDDQIDHRSGAALVFAGDGVAFALGGTIAGSDALAAEDAMLDTGCVMGGCAVRLGLRPLLAQRRRDGVAALAEGDRVLVASGTGADGMPAATVEVIDVTTARAPVPGVAVGSLPYEGLSLLPLEMGSVWIAGGGQTASWLYRH